MHFPFTVIIRFELRRYFCYKQRILINRMFLHFVRHLHYNYGIVFANQATSWLLHSYLNCPVFMQFWNYFCLIIRSYLAILYRYLYRTLPPLTVLHLTLVKSSIDVVKPARYQKYSNWFLLRNTGIGFPRAL